MSPDPTDADAHALERRLQREKRERMRPGTPRSGWAIIVLAVVLIIFFGLAAWVSLPRNPAQGQRPMDHEAVFAVVTGFQERWPSLPGPPERHRQAAAEAGPGRPAAAAEELAKAASLDGNDADTLLQLIILAAREPSVTLLGPVQAQKMVAALAETAPPSDLLPAARAWQALQRGEAEAALAALGPEDASAPAASARLEAMLRLGADPAPAAAAVLRRDPADPEACVVLSRLRLGRGELAEAEALATDCLAAGVARPELHRALAEIAWLVGDPARAAASWRAAGAALHAAAAQAAFDGPGWQEAAREALGPLDRSDLPPPVAAQAVYLGLAAPDADWVRAGVRALSALSAPDPHARIALATGQLAQGAPDAALATLAELDGTDTALLRGRALWALGRRDEARSQLQTALDSDVWNPHLWRVLADWDASEDPQRGQARVMAFLARPPVEALLRLPPDPVDRPGARLAPEPWPTGDLSPGASAALAVATALAGAPTPPDAVTESGAGDLVLAGWLAARQGEPGPWVDLLRAAGPEARLSAAWALRHRDPAGARALLDPAATDLASAVIRAETALAGDSAAVAPGDGGDEEIARLLGDSPGMAGLLRERYLVGVQRRAPAGVKR